MILLTEKQTQMAIVRYLFIINRILDQKSELLGSHLKLYKLYRLHKGIPCMLRRRNLLFLENLTSIMRRCLPLLFNKKSWMREFQSRFLS